MKGIAHKEGNDIVIRLEKTDRQWKGKLFVKVIQRMWEELGCPNLEVETKGLF